MLPKIEKLRAEAKKLKKAFASGDIDAAARLHAKLPNIEKPKHADFLHLLARENGFTSWPALKAATEAAQLDRTQKIKALERAVLNGSFLMLDRLFEQDPDLVDAHLGLQIAFARAAKVREAIEGDLSLANVLISERPPLCWLTYSKLVNRKPEIVTDQLAILDTLIAAGAEPNASIPAEPDSDHRLSALYGAIGHSQNLALAEALLKAGANPNDNESLYHATEMPTLDGVKLLFSHGAEVGRTNAFLRLLDIENPEGVKLFLANGADPNAPPYRHPSDEPAEARNALHHAIIRGRSAEIAALLLDAGVDTEMPFGNRSSYALARICGNRDIARLLKERDLDTQLTPAETFLAAIADIDDRKARATLETHPDLWQDLSHFDKTRQTELAMRRECQPVLELMADLGFDINLQGESDMPPIHAAAWWGHAEIVEMYIARGANLDIENMFGGETLGTAIHGSANCPARDEGDYERTVLALLNAGAVIRPDSGHLEMGTDNISLLLESTLESG